VHDPHDGGSLVLNSTYEASDGCWCCWSVQLMAINCLRGLCWLPVDGGAQLLDSGVLCGWQSLEVFCRERGTRGMVMKVIKGQSDRGRYEGLVEELRELEGEVTLGAALDTNALAAQMHAELQAVALYTSVRECGTPGCRSVLGTTNQHQLHAYFHITLDVQPATDSP
jgi:hypothetical protein